MIHVVAVPRSAKFVVLVQGNGSYNCYAVTGSAGPHEPAPPDGVVVMAIARAFHHRVDLARWDETPTKPEGTE